MSDLTPSAQAVLAAQHGVITTRGLRASGVGRTTVARLLDAGVFRQPHRGVYVSTAAPATLEQRCAVVSAAHPGGFITGPSAGMLLGLRRMPRSAAIHLAVRHGVHLDPEPGVRLRQTTKIRPADWQVRPDGIVIASPARLAFDLAGDLRAIDHLSVVEQMLNTALVTGDELLRIGARLCHPARRGSTTFEFNLSRLGSTPRQSHPEVMVAEALRDRGVPVVAQLAVVRPDGRPARLDLAVPAVRWGVEIDVHDEHRTYDGRGRDAHRYRDLHGSDWQIEPVSDADLDDLDELADELAGLYRQRCAKFGRHSPAS